MDEDSFGINFAIGCTYISDSNKKEPNPVIHGVSMNEATVAYTMFALLLASAVCLLIGSAFGVMFKSYSNRTNRQELEAQLNNSQMELVKLKEQPSDQQDIRNLRKQKDVQDKLIKSFMKANLLLKKANSVSTQRLDETQRKLALQKVTSENWKLKSETMTGTYQQLKTKIAATRQTNSQATPVVQPITTVSAPVLRTHQTSETVSADDLTKIKGIGPTICKALYEHGITHFEQMAKLEIDQVRELDKKLGRYGRMERLDWVSAARELSKADENQTIAA